MAQSITTERHWGEIVADMNALVGEARNTRALGQNGQATYEHLCLAMARLTQELTTNPDARNRGVRHDGKYLLGVELGLIPITGLGGADHGPC